MHGDMSRDAERTVSVRIGAIRVAVSYLRCSRHHHQQDAQNRQE
jgi:hypothetical protein